MYSAEEFREHGSEEADEAEEGVAGAFEGGYDFVRF
jgi:hypothetical protein